MKIGPIMALVWILLASSSIITTIVMAIVKGVSSLKWSVQIVLGTLLYYGFVSAGVGVSEGVWTMTSPGFLVALTIGIGGVVLTIIGVRGLVHTRPTGPQNGTKT